MPRPVVAIISNALTPYRLHFHRRLVRELPAIEWWSLFTHDVSNAPWAPADEADIRPVRFGPGERSDDQSKPSRALHEYRKGGRMIRWLADHPTAAVILLGYNDPGRLRVLNWCRRHGVPCFLFGDSNVRGDQATGVKARVKHWLLPRIFRRCAGILPCGSLGRAYFRRYGVSDNRMFDMPYEPDYDLVAGETDAEVRAEYSKRGLPPDRDYFLYCGRLVGIKRVDVLIDAFVQASNKRPDWDLLLVGGGPLHAALEGRVPEAVRSRVHWVGFSDDQSVVARLQRGARVMAVPSEFEPWGVVVNEGVAAGLAIVASDAVGAAAELVRDGVNGRLVPAGDVTAWSAALLDVSDPVNLSRYRRASAAVLADWRQRGDPVAGVAAALCAAGVTVALPAQP